MYESMIEFDLGLRLNYENRFLMTFCGPNLVLNVTNQKMRSNFYLFPYLYLNFIFSYN